MIWEEGTRDEGEAEDEAGEAEGCRGKIAQRENTGQVPRVPRGMDNIVDICLELAQRREVLVWRQLGGGYGALIAEGLRTVAFEPRRTAVVHWVSRANSEINVLGVQTRIGKTAGCSGRSLHSSRGFRKLSEPTAKSFRECFHLLLVLLDNQPVDVCLLGVLLTTNMRRRI